MRVLIHFFVAICLFLPGCGRKNVDLVPDSERQIIFEPLGKDQKITTYLPLTNSTAIVALNNARIAKLDNRTLNTEWSIGMDLEDMFLMDDGSILCIERSNLDYNNLAFKRIGQDGKPKFAWPDGNLMIQDYPDSYEDYLCGTPDGNNGIYLLIFKQEFGRERHTIEPNRTFILHIDANNQIDLKIPLTEYFFRIACNENGELFGLHLAKNYSDYVVGFYDSLKVSRINLTDLKAGAVTKDWTRTFYLSTFKGTERYRPLLLHALSDQVIVAGQVEESFNAFNGTRYYTYNNTGQLKNSTVTFFNESVDYYIFGGNLKGFKTKNGVFYSINFGANSDINYIDKTGTVKLEKSLKGDINKCNIMAIAYDDTHIWAAGSSGHGRIPVEQPFLFRLPFKLP